MFAVPSCAFYLPPSSPWPETGSTTQPPHLSPKSDQIRLSCQSDWSCMSCWSAKIVCLQEVWKFTILLPVRLVVWPFLSHQRQTIRRIGLITILMVVKPYAWLWAALTIFYMEKVPRVCHGAGYVLYWPSLLVGWAHKWSTALASAPTAPLVDQRGDAACQFRWSALCLLLSQ